MPRITKFFLLLLLTTVCRSSLLFGQSWTIYNTGNSGLPDDNIRALAVDQQQTKWIGTDAGLVKFDGTSWTVYNTTNSGLPDNSVRTIVVDDTNAIWIGTFQGGLARFNGTAPTQFSPAILCEALHLILLAIYGSPQVRDLRFTIGILGKCGTPAILFYSPIIFQQLP
jgi:hypothetical protein